MLVDKSYLPQVFSLGLAHEEMLQVLVAEAVVLVDLTARPRPVRHPRVQIEVDDFLTRDPWLATRRCVVPQQSHVLLANFDDCRATQVLTGRKRVYIELSLRVDRLQPILRQVGQTIVASW